MSATPEVIDRDDYCNVVEIASACRALAARFPNRASTFDLAPTHERRTAVGLDLGGGAPANAPVFMVIGGLHGDEWGSSEIILNFASDLLHGEAVGLDYGGQAAFGAAQVQALLDGLHLVLVPLLNPDGREHSRVSGQRWRKNRRPLSNGQFGVDLNRNFGFAFGAADDPAGEIVSGDANPASNHYRGASAFSEPEAGNVRHLVEHYDPDWFVDLHSGDRCVVHPRSVGPWHAEPLDAAAESAHVALASAYVDGVAASAPGAAQPRVPIKLGSAYTLASGTAHDWVHARARRGPPALALMVEWSKVPCPDWLAMQPILLEVSAGLVAMGLSALAPAVA